LYCSPPTPEGRAKNLPRVHAWRRFPRPLLLTRRPAITAVVKWIHSRDAQTAESSTRPAHLFASETATALAQHWREAGDRERALEYLLLAAEQAGRGWAKDEAAKLYGEALDLIPEGSQERRRELGRKQALALAALAHVEDARRLSRPLGLESADL
jgi:hypothetical protein